MTDPADLTNTYSLGMGAVIFLISSGVGLIGFLEYVCDRHRWPSISYRVEGWSDRNPWFGAAVVTLLFVLLAHFVLNELYPPLIRYEPAPRPTFGP